MIVHWLMLTLEIPAGSKLVMNIKYYKTKKKYQRVIKTKINFNIEMSKKLMELEFCEIFLHPL